jgi:hypothetical protein
MPRVGRSRRSEAQKNNLKKALAARHRKKEDEGKQTDSPLTLESEATDVALSKPKPKVGETHVYVDV